METRTPIIVVSGPLGSGKTTLLRHVLETTRRKLAIIMNEFGEIAIDSKILEGKSVRMAELAGGCVCCSLIGEFEAAVNEIIDTVAPEHIIVETTGVAEPGALTFDIQENVPRVRLDGVVSVIDADGLLTFPALGHTTRMQIEAADLILLNKVDLVGEAEPRKLETTLHEINSTAPIVRTRRCAVDPDLLFGITRTREVLAPPHLHHLEFASFIYTTTAIIDQQAFVEFASWLAPHAYRAKGFIRSREGSFLFNFVNGRWDLEPFVSEQTTLVFIGKALDQRRIEDQLKACLRPPQPYEFLEDVAIADIAFRARGKDLPEVFIAAADATLNAMIDNPGAIEPREQRAIHLTNEALDLLLFNFLNEFLYYKDSEQLLLRVQRVQIAHDQGAYQLTAEARGEKLDADRHHQRVDVKAVTLHHFKLEQTAQGWEALVILDI